MPTTYKPIQSIALTADTSSIIFSGIDQNYTDLTVISQYQVSVTGYTNISINSDANTYYSATYEDTSGSTSVSSRNSSQTSFNGEMYGLTTANNGMAIYHFLNYSNTNLNKVGIGRYWYGAPDVTSNRVLLWRSTAAITQLTFARASGNWSAGSTFSLYGIKNA